MDQILRPIAPRVTVAAADDPYKKYWWVVLAAFALPALWLCLPLLGTPVGAPPAGLGRPRVDAGAEQDLAASAVLPADAAGQTAGGARRGADFVAGESPDAAPAEGAPAAASSAGDAAAAGADITPATLAQALKDASSSSGGAGGWGGERARRGFDAPRLSGGGLGGLGRASGGSSASMPGTEAFGIKNARPVLDPGSVGGTSSNAAGDARASGARGSMAALSRAAEGARAASFQAGGDGAAQGVSRVFDGAGKQNAIAFSGAAGAAYARLDSAPANLKVNDPKLDQKKFDEQAAPPSAPAPPAANVGQQIAVALVTTVVTAGIGGLVGGTAGQIIASAGASAINEAVKADNARREADAKRKADEAAARSRGRLRVN